MLVIGLLLSGGFGVGIRQARFTAWGDPRFFIVVNYNLAGGGLILHGNFQQNQGL